MTDLIVASLFLAKLQLIKLSLNLRQITLETTSVLSSVGRLPIPIDPPLLQEVTSPKQVPLHQQEGSYGFFDFIQSKAYQQTPYFEHKNDRYDILTIF